MGSAASSRKYKKDKEKEAAIEEEEEEAEAYETEEQEEGQEEAQTRVEEEEDDEDEAERSNTIHFYREGGPPPHGSGEHAHCKVLLLGALDIQQRGDKLPRPHCVCIVAGKPRISCKTGWDPEEPQTLTPEWGQEFDMKIKPEDSLKFFLMDGLVRLGVATLKNKDFYPRGFEGQIQLEDDEGERDGSSLLVKINVSKIEDAFYFKPVREKRPDLEELQHQKVWHRPSRFNKMTREWLDGEEWMDEEDVPEEEPGDKDSEDEKQEEEEEEDSEESETSSQAEEREQKEEDAALEKLQAEFKEWKRMEDLRNDPNHQGWKKWVSNRSWRHEFRDKERLEYLDKFKKWLFPPPPPEQPRRKGKYNWWYVPSMEPDEDGTRYAYRDDFIKELLIIAETTAGPMYRIGLDVARKLFKKEPQIAYSLKDHREVLGLDGEKELWSLATIQSIEVSLKRQGLADEVDVFGVPLQDQFKQPVEKVEKDNKRNFPEPQTGKYKFFVEPVRKPPPKVMKSAKNVRDFLEDLKMHHGLQVENPEPPDVPTFLPSRQIYEDFPEVWNDLQPPGWHGAPQLFRRDPPEKFIAILNGDLPATGKLVRRDSYSTGSSQSGSRLRAAGDNIVSGSVTPSGSSTR